MEVILSNLSLLRVVVVDPSALEHNPLMGVCGSLRVGRQESDGYGDGNVPSLPLMQCQILTW